MKQYSSENKNLVVFVDGIYSLESSQDSIREENIMRANVLKHLVGAYKIPLFASVEVRKNRFALAILMNLLMRLLHIMILWIRANLPIMRK